MRKALEFPQIDEGKLDAVEALICSHCRQRTRYRRRGAGGPGRSHGQSPH